MKGKFRMSDLNDQPIANSKQDCFGFNNLAKKIAKAISKNKRLEGAVIAINGSWGVGKSSLINLIVNEIHNLNKKGSEKEIVISQFNCWWVRGEEALISEFFRQIFSVIESDSKKIRKEIKGLGSRVLLNSAPILGSLSNIVASGSKEVVTETLNLFGKLLEEEDNLDELHSKLGKLLRNGDKRYLVIIDDIDRLLPAESILVFKLIKTIGRLPNFSYLIAYDRSVTEKVIRRRFPTDNPHFLEKIVQVSFDVPHSPRSVIRIEFLKFIKEVLKIENASDDTHFRHHFENIIFPRITTPRELVKIFNILGFTWSAVENEADYADFIAIETIRIYYPELYTAIKNEKHNLVVDKFDLASLQRPVQKIFTFVDCIDSVDEEVKIRLTDGLKYMFRTAEVTSPSEPTHSISKYDLDLMRKRRSICIEQYFDTYFQFDIGDKIISQSELENLRSNCNDREFIRNFIIDTLNNKDNPEKIHYLLHEIVDLIQELPMSECKNILVEVIMMHDQICDALSTDLYSSELHFVRDVFKILLNVARSRFSNLKEWSEYLRSISDNFSFKFKLQLISIQIMISKSRPHKGKYNILSVADKNRLGSEVSSRIEEMAENNELFKNKDLFNILFWWDSLYVKKSTSKANDWIKKNINDQEFVVNCANNFLFKDNREFIDEFEKVKPPRYHIPIDDLRKVLDFDLFANRVNELLESGRLDEESKTVLKRFKSNIK